MSIQLFLDYLEKRKTDRGLMADLRHGFSPGTEYRAWPHLAKWRQCRLSNDRDRKIWTTVAAGFALHKGTAIVGNIGWTLRSMATDGQDFSEEAMKRLESRMRRLLSCRTAEDVCDRLPGIIRMAERKGVPVNYEQLFWDLVQWEDQKKNIKVKWAESYWQGPSKTGEGGANVPDSNTN